MSAHSSSGSKEDAVLTTDARTALLVVGMHRSGTSALARVMSLLGCDLPRTVMPGGVGNELGHWESDEIFRLNEALLESAGTRWDEWKPINPGWYQSPKFAEFRNRATEVLAEEFGQSRLFVLKDPRVSLIAPFWLDVLANAGVQPVVVVAVRNPEDVAHSMYARDGRDRAYGHLVWLRNLLESESATRGCRRVYVSYDALLKNWPMVIERLQEQSGLTLPRSMQSAHHAIEEFLREDQRHFASNDQRTIANPLISSWVRESFEVFLRWSGDGERAEDYPALDRVRNAFDCSIDAFSDLVAAGSIAGATTHDLKARIEELRSSEGHVARLSEELAVVVEQMSEQEAAAAGAAVELRAQLAELESQLADKAGREAESAEAVAALREQLAELESQLADKAGREAESAETVTALRIEIAERQSQLAIQLDRERLLLAEAQEAEKAMNDQLGQLRSELDQRRAELEDTHAELGHVRKAAEEVEERLRSECEAALKERQKAVSDLVAAQDEAMTYAVALERAQDQEASLRKALASAEMRIDGLNFQLSKAREESRALRNIAQEKDGELADLRIEFEATINEKNAEIGRIAAAREAANQQIGVRFQEIAVLSRALQDERDAGQAREQAADRLMEINKVLSRVGPWQSWMPQNFVRKQQLKLLKRRQLFDADIYLKLNEDVARNGTDALRHYLLHGHREGRRTGLD